MFITEAILCLALNVYHEAKNQPFIGQVAVAQVVMNRVYDERYPDTICEVVEQGPTYSWKPDFPIRNRCQFSWYCDGRVTHLKKKMHGIQPLQLLMVYTMVIYIWMI